MRYQDCDISERLYRLCGAVQALRQTVIDGYAVIVRIVRGICHTFEIAFSDSKALRILFAVAVEQAV